MPTLARLMQVPWASLDVHTDMATPGFIGVFIVMMMLDVALG